MTTKPNASFSTAGNTATNGKHFKTDDDFTNGKVNMSGILDDSKTETVMNAIPNVIITDKSGIPAVSYSNAPQSSQIANEVSSHTTSTTIALMPLVNDEREYSCGLCSLRPKWLQKFANKQTFLAIFCLTSVLQGMYYTYFVSVLTTIEKLYQIQSKTTGMIMSATEIGQIGGALLLTYYGGHGHRPKWIACGMLIFAFASVLCSTPHYLFGSDIGIKSTPVKSHSTETMASLKLREHSSKLCFNFSSSLSKYSSALSTSSSSDYSSDNLLNSLNYTNIKNGLNSELLSTNSWLDSKCDHPEVINTKTRITNTVLSIFFVSLLLIGIGATAVNTLGIPYIDDNVAPKESPLYFGINIKLFDCSN
jgi:hypothetical protein